MNLAELVFHINIGTQVMVRLPVLAGAPLRLYLTISVLATVTLE